MEVGRSFLGDGFMRLRFVVALVLASAAVGFGCAHGPRDTALAETITTHISADQQLKSSSLSVSVKQGVATITGNVPDDSARLEAYKIAAQTPGVKKVDDQMSSITAPPQASSENPQPVPAVATSPMPVAETPKADRKTKSRAAAANSEPAQQTPDASNAPVSTGQSASGTTTESPA